MMQTDLKKFLIKLNKNYQTLREREAKYAAAAPLDLLNQIEDYEQAIELTKQAIGQNIALDDLQTQFTGLNLQIDGVVFVVQELPRKPFTGRNPYRGLRKFTEDEAEFFFGRTAAIEELLDTVKRLVNAETSREVPDLVVVLGPSGSGKSSLVRAGLIPALREGRLPGSEQWPVRTMVPGPNPLTNLAAQFVEPTGRGLPSLRADLEVGEQVLHQLMIESLTLAEKPDEAVFVLMVDQFEELFTLCKDESERQAFLDQLLHVAQVQHNRGFIILAMRADFYAKAALYIDLAKTITQNQMLVSPMTERELREAILLPAEAVGLELEKALVESLLKDTAKAPGMLPLLQHTLQELFERREGNLLTLAAYQEVGGVQGSLAHRADAIMDSLTTDQQQMARRVFMRLVQLGEGTLDTRRRALFDELLTQASQMEAVDGIVQKLANANLVVTDRNPETGEVVLDVAHEALIQQWPQLRQWLDQDRQGFRIRQQLSQAAREWDSRGRDEDSLYRGLRLLETEEWVAVNPGEINPLEVAFLEASAAARERAKRRNQMVIAGLTLGLVVAVSAGIFGFVQRNRAMAGEAAAEIGKVAAEAAQATAEAERAEAERQARIARSREVATLSSSELNKNNYELALALAIEAGRIEDTREAASAIRSAFAHPWHSLHVLEGHTFSVRHASWSQNASRILTINSDNTARIWDAASGQELVTLKGHTDLIWEATWNQDESRILTASSDRTARIWDSASGQELVTLKGHTDFIRHATWSQDESRILTVSNDGTARIWDAESGQELVTLKGHTHFVLWATWSQDESRILTASSDDTARIWDAASGQELVTLKGHTDFLTQATWNQDESRILTTAGNDDTVRIWDAKSGQELVTLEGRKAWVGPDKSRILTAGNDGTLRILDFESGQELITLEGHTSYVSQASWSQDESRILTASSDGTARIWDAQSGQELVTLEGHTGSINQATWSQDESRILTASDDGTARIWDTESGQELVTLKGHTDSVSQATWSQDESRILTASDDDTARVWDAQSGQELVTLEGHTAFILQATWNHDESRILTASDDGMARVWDAESGQELVTLEGHTDLVWEATWNQDESRILTVGNDDTIRIWDSASGQELVTLKGHVALVSQDESRILTVSYDDKVRIWDAESGQELVTLEGHTGYVLQASWNQDETRILTASNDGTVRIWDAESGQELVTLEGYTDGVNQATWSQDESRILTVGCDEKEITCVKGTARIWDAESGQELVTLEGHTGYVSQATWSQDESHILTASNDGTARIWDSESGQELVSLEGHTGYVSQASWNQDESRILTASSDGTARIWYSRMEDLLEAACRKAPRNMTRKEWQQFMKGQVYRATCPNLPIEPAE